MKFASFTFVLLTAGLLSSCQKSAVEPALCGNEDHPISTAYVIEDNAASAEEVNKDIYDSRIREDEEEVRQDRRRPGRNNTRKARPNTRVKRVQRGR